MHPIVSPPKTTPITVNLPSTKYIYVSGNYDITLPFSATTGIPDHNAIYDAATGNPVAYDNIAAFNGTERLQ